MADVMLGGENLGAAEGSDQQAMKLFVEQNEDRREKHEGKVDMQEEFETLNGDGSNVAAEERRSDDTDTTEEFSQPNMAAHEEDDDISEGSFDEEDSQLRISHMLERPFEKYGKNGEITEESFIKFIQSEVTWTNHEDALLSFKKFDANGKGVISFEEFSNLISSLVIRANQEKALIEKNFKSIDKLFDEEEIKSMEDGGYAGVIPFDVVCDLLKTKFGIVLSQDEFKMLTNRYPYSMRKGVTKTEFKNIATTMLLSSKAPKIFQFVYGSDRKSNQNSTGLNSVFEVCPLCEKSFKNKLQNRSYLEAMKEILHISDDELLAQLAELREGEKAAKQRLQVVQSRDQKIIEAQRKQLKESDKNVEHMQRTIDQLGALLEESNEDGNRLAAATIAQLELQLAQRERVVKDLERKAEIEAEERKDLIENLKVNNTATEEYEHRILRLEEKMLHMNSKMRDMKQVAVEQDQEIQRLELAHATKSRHHKAAENTVKRLGKRLTSMETELLTARSYSESKISEPGNSFAQMEEAANAMLMEATKLAGTGSKPIPISFVPDDTGLLDAEEDVTSLKRAIKLQTKRAVEAEIAKDKAEEARIQAEDALHEAQQITRQRGISEGSADSLALSEATERQLDAALKALHSRKKRVRSLERDFKIVRERADTLEKKYKKERQRKRSEGWMSEHDMKQFQEQIKDAKENELKLQQLEKQLEAALESDKVTSQMLAKAKQGERIALQDAQRAEEKQFKLQQQLDQAVEIERTLLKKLNKVQAELEVRKEVARADDGTPLSAHELRQELKKVQQKATEEASVHKKQIKDLQEEIKSLKDEAKNLVNSVKQSTVAKEKREQELQEAQMEKNALSKALGDAKEKDQRAAEQLESIWRRAKEVRIGISDEPKETPSSTSKRLSEYVEEKCFDHDDEENNAPDVAPNQMEDRTSIESSDEISLRKTRQRGLSQQLRQVEREFLLLQNALEDIRQRVKEARSKRRKASKVLEETVGKEEKVLRRLSSLGSHHDKGSGTVDAAYFRAVEIENQMLEELQKVQERKRTANEEFETAQEAYTQAKKQEHNLLEQLKLKQERGEEAMRQLEEARSEELILIEQQRAADAIEKFREADRQCRQQELTISELTARLEASTKRETALLRLRSGKKAEDETVTVAFSREKESLNKVQELKQQQQTLEEKIRTLETERNELVIGRMEAEGKNKKAREREDKLHEEVNELRQKVRELKAKVKLLKREKEDLKAKVKKSNHWELKSQDMESSRPEINGRRTPTSKGGAKSYVSVTSSRNDLVTQSHSWRKDSGEDRFLEPTPDNSKVGWLTIFRRKNGGNRPHKVRDRMSSKSSHQSSGWCFCLSTQG